MPSTSDENGSAPKAFDPLQQVTPFFNRAQLHAFSIPPREEALGTVRRGGSHEYLPQEYVRALLDRFIGPGRWAIRTSLVKTIEERISKADKINIAVTAIVNAELDILSAVDPDKRLTYGGIGTHTMEAKEEMGVAAVVGNAITSAESKALKAAAKNLGRAFGSDLKNKLDRSTLPPSIMQYAAQLSEIARQRQDAVRLPAPDAPTEPTGDGDASAPAVEQHRGDGRVENGRSAQRVDAEAAATDAATAGVAERAPATGRSAATPEAGPPGAAAPAAEPDARQANGAVTTAGGTPSDPPREGVAEEPAKQVDWELSIHPGTSYENWILCLQTLGRRINAMTSAKELERFLGRYPKLLKDLPQLKAEGDRPAKDFKARFRRIVRKRYEELDAPVPAAYAEPEPVAA